MWKTMSKPSKKEKYVCWACEKEFIRKKEEFYCPVCSKMSVDELREKYPSAFMSIHAIRPTKIQSKLDKMGLNKKEQKKFLGSIEMTSRDNVITGHAGDV